jgi:hypothetical protein
MEDIRRLRHLAGLNEQDVFSPDDIDAPDPEAEEQDRRIEREQKITKLIIAAARRIGLPFDSYDRNSIYYDDATREGVINLDDDVALTKLMHLHQSGLANDYKIVAGSGGIRIEFLVKPELDHAV